MLIENEATNPGIFRRENAMGIRKTEMGKRTIMTIPIITDATAICTASIRVIGLF